jgi:arabinogalactan endo-1,4-beta-galactosidase
MLLAFLRFVNEKRKLCIYPYGDVEVIESQSVVNALKESGSRTQSFAGKNVELGESLSTDLAKQGLLSEISTKERGVQLVDEKRRRSLKKMFGVDLSAYDLMDGRFQCLDFENQEIGMLELLRRHGVNVVRLRLFVDPNMKKNVVNDIDYTINLAKKMKSSGLELFLDIQYSDHWCDPGDQAKPKAWAELSFADLSEKVYDYTFDVMKRFHQVDVYPVMVQVGNEISPGFLWPSGKVNMWKEEWNRSENWNKLAQLLTSGIQAIDDHAQKNELVKPLVAIHTTFACNWKATREYFQHLVDENVRFDVIAQSYYPYLHGAMKDAEEVMNLAIKTFDKEYLFAEVAYPYFEVPKVVEKKKLKWHSEAMKFGMSLEAQADFLKALNGVAKRSMDDRCLGYFWWFPESMTIDYKIRKKSKIRFDQRFHAWNRGATAMFRYDMDKLPSLMVLPNPVIKEMGKL